MIFTKWGDFLQYITDRTKTQAEKIAAIRDNLSGSLWQKSWVNCIVAGMLWAEMDNQSSQGVGVDSSIEIRVTDQERLIAIFSKLNQKTVIFAERTDRYKHIAGLAVLGGLDARVKIQSEENFQKIAKDRALEKLALGCGYNSGPHYTETQKKLEFIFQGNVLHDLGIVCVDTGYLLGVQPETLSENGENIFLCPSHCYTVTLDSQEAREIKALTVLNKSSVPLLSDQKTHYKFLDLSLADARVWLPQCWLYSHEFYAVALTRLMGLLEYNQLDVTLFLSYMTKIAIREMMFCIDRGVFPVEIEQSGDDHQKLFQDWRQRVKIDLRHFLESYPAMTEEHFLKTWHMTSSAYGNMMSAINQIWLENESKLLEAIKLKLKGAQYRSGLLKEPNTVSEQPIVVRQGGVIPQAASAGEDVKPDETAMYYLTVQQAAPKAERLFLVCEIANVETVRSHLSARGMTIVGDPMIISGVEVSKKLIFPSEGIDDFLSQLANGTQASSPAVSAAGYFKSATNARLSSSGNTDAPAGIRALGIL